MFMLSLMQPSGLYELEKDSLEAISAQLLQMIQMKSYHLYTHSIQVSNYAVSIAAKMGLPLNEIEQIRHAALLHDVGLLMVPNALIQKSPYLNKQEMSKYKQHAASGANMIENYPCCQQILPYIRYHHEKWDGSGYPEGLAGTLSAVAHTLIGFMCGRLLLEKISVNKRIVKLITAAVIMLVIGYVLSIWMPINKRVWSTTFVLVTCGWGSLLLALLMYVIDVKNINKGWTFFLVFGMNPLFLYVLSEVVAIIFSQWEIKDAIYHAITMIISDEYLASLVYSLLFCSVMGLTGYIFHRKRIYIKI